METRPDPLEEYYERRGRAAPDLRAVDAGAVPEPYRGLLAHKGNMTPTLSGHFGGKEVGLTVLDRETKGGLVSRWVLLTVGGRPVEFGCVHIDVDRLPPAARDEVVHERRPLGAVLVAHNVDRESRPSMFFSLRPDDHLAALLEMPPRGDGPPRLLYGRKNTIVDGAGAVIAEVVEVLPPL